MMDSRGIFDPCYQTLRCSPVYKNDALKTLTNEKKIKNYGDMGLSNIIPGKKPEQNGDSDKPSTSFSSSISDDVFIKNNNSSPQRLKESKDRHSREPPRRSYDPHRNTYDPHRRHKERSHQRPMYDSRRRERDPSPQGRRSRQDGYNGSYERNGRYSGDSYGYSRDYVPGKPPSSPRRSRSHQSPNRSYSPSRIYNTGRSTSPPRNHSPTRSQSPTRPRSPSPDRVHNHAFVSEGNREVTINSEAKREEVEFHFDESGQRVTTGHTVIAVTAYRAPQSPDGPPKPPRRQQSLNRIHIPDGPDYDPTSASESPHSSPNSPQITRHQREPNYANYSSSGYSQSDITYTEHTQSHNATTARIHQYTRQRSLPETRNGYQDNPPTYRDVEDYRARAVKSDYTESRNKPMHVKGRRNIDSSNRMYRSDGELSAALSEPELDWERRPRHQLQHSDSLRTDPGRYSTGERPYRPTHLKHTDSLRSAPGGYSYGNSWQDEPSWKRDPRSHYQLEQSAFHGSLVRPSRRDQVPRSQRPGSVPFPDKYGSTEGSYNPQYAKFDERSRSPDYDNYPTSRQPGYSQQGPESNGWRHGKRSVSASKQGYSSDSGVSSFRNPSESDPVYENTERKQHDSQYAKANGHHNKKNGIWERDGGEYVIDGHHEMPVDVPVEMQQQQQLESAPLMTSPPKTKEGSIPGNHTVPRDEIQEAQSASTQDSKWAAHLARREQRREHLRSSSQDSIESNDKLDHDLIETKPRPQRRHTTEINLTSEGIIQPKQADTQESGYPNEMPKRQQQGGRAPSQGANMPNSGYHVPYSDSNAPYAPKRPYDPYNPYHYGPYGEVPSRMNYPPPVHGYPPYGPPMSPVDPRYGAQSPNPYSSDHSYDNQHAPGKQSPTMPRKGEGWGNRPQYSEGGPPRWHDPRYGPMAYPQDPYMPYGQATETYSAAYSMPPYLQQGGYYQPPIPSAMFYGGYPGEVRPQGIPPGMGSPQRARSVDALELQANVQPELHSSPAHSPSASLSPQRSLSPDEKTKRMHELRQRVKSYIPTEEKPRSKSVDISKPAAREEMIAPTQASVAHAANVPNPFNAPDKSNRPDVTDGSNLGSVSQPQESRETATSVGAKLFLQKKKQAAISEMKKKMIQERMYGSEPELASEREVPSKSSSARPLRVSSGSGNDTSESRQSRRKAEKITEDALNELEEMYALLDKEAADLLESGEYHPQYERLTELKFRAKSRLEDLRLEKEMEEQGLTAPSQRGKRRPRRERAKSDITGDNYRSHSLSNLTQSDDDRQQQFFPYRTSQHPDNLDLDNQSYKPPKPPQKMQFIKRNTDSSSDEEGSEYRQPQSTLYRHPRSEDYLGYSSDSSPSPERRMRNSKRKPVAQPRGSVKDGEEQVLPEYIKRSSADTEHSAPKSGYDSDKSGRSSLADRRREFFLSGSAPSSIQVDLNRPLSPHKEVAKIAFTEIKLLSSTAMTSLHSSKPRSVSPLPRSVSPLPRGHSPLSVSDSSTTHTRSISLTSVSRQQNSRQQDKKSPPNRQKVTEPTMINVSNRPVEQSAPRRPVPAPRKTLTVPSVENQPAGARTSVSSVSTIDSTGLAQPFEEMGREYGVIIGEHYPHHVSGHDLSRHSSSMDSLVQTVTNVPKRVPKREKHRAPPAPSQPPPESDLEKSGDEKGKKQSGGIWALLGPRSGQPVKSEPQKVPDESKTAPLPSPEPTLTSDSESEHFEMPGVVTNSTDESFQTPRSTTSSPLLSPPPQMEAEINFEIEEPVHAIAVKAPELPPDLFVLPLANLDNVPFMDSDAESSNVAESKDGSVVPYHDDHPDIPFADSDDESVDGVLKIRKEIGRDDNELQRGPNGSAPLAYDENDLEIPDPAQFGKETSSRKSSRKARKEQERQTFEADQEVAAITRDQEASPNIVSPLSADDLPQNNNNMMSTARQPKSVAQLRNQYATDEPPPFETSAERRRNYMSSPSARTSYRSGIDTDSRYGGTSGSRFSNDRSTSPLTRSGSSHGGDYTSSYKRPDHLSTARTSSESSYSRRSPTTGRSYTPTSTPSSSSRRYERSDSGSKYSAPSVDHHHKRPGTESGYNSLERGDKRTGKLSTSSQRPPPLSDIDSINYIRDRYLGGSKTNGDIERTHSPTTRSHSDLSLRHTGSTPISTSSGNRLTHQNSLPSGSDTEDPESRAARIARYKEQRRKELAQKYGLGTSIIPLAGENDYASRKYNYNRTSSLKSDDESDISTRSEVSERTDRYRRYNRDADPRRQAGITQSRLGSERDTRGTKGRISPSHDPLRHRSLTEPIHPSQVSTVKDHGRRDRSESASTVGSENKLARKDSIISEETQLLIANLEASRAARRQRLRRSESESRDDADRIIAKHRARYGSESSDKEVFSPRRTTAPESFDKSPDQYRRTSRTSATSTPVETQRRTSTRESAVDRKKEDDSTDVTKTKATMPDRRKSRSSEGSESGDTSDPAHRSSARSRRSRRMNVTVTSEELKEAHKLQGTKSPTSESPGDDVFSPTTTNRGIEQSPLPISVIPEEITNQVNGMGVNRSIRADESRNQRSSKPTAKVEPVKKVVTHDANIAEEREKRRARRREELAESVLDKRPGSPTKHTSQRPKSPTKALNDSSKRPGSPVKDSRRPSSPTKDAKRSATSAKDSRRPSSPTKDVRRPNSPTKLAAERTRNMRSQRREESKSTTTKTQNQRPEIPQVLKQSRARSNSIESNSSAASEGRRSPTKHVSRGNSRDSLDSRGSPTGSPKHKAYKEPSARLLELAKPRRTPTPEAEQNEPPKSNEKKTAFVSTKVSASPKRQPKMRMSKEAERRLKASQKTDTTPVSTVAPTQKSKDDKTSSEEEPQKVVVSVPKKTLVKADIVPSVVAVEEQEAPKVFDVHDDTPRRVDNKDESDGLIEKPKERADSVEIVSAVQLSPEVDRSSSKSPEPEDIKKEALSKKDSDLIAMMKARAERLEQEMEDQQQEKVEKQVEQKKEKFAFVEPRKDSIKDIFEKETESEEEKVDVMLEMQPKLPISVSHRARAFQLPSGTRPPKLREKSTESPPTSPAPSLTSPTTKVPPVTSPTTITPPVTSPTTKSAPKISPGTKSSPLTSPTRSPIRSLRSPTGSPIRSPTRSPTKNGHPEQIQILPDRLTAGDSQTPNDTAEEEEEDPLLKLSVSEKMRMFTHLQQKRAKDQAAIKPRHRHFRRVRDSDRSQTQPVTPEELSEASNIAKEMANKAKSESKEKISETKLQEIIEEEKEDELSKLSLAEKMKLFHQKAETKVEPLPKVEVPRRRKRSESRYKTQPVTIEEVKKAAKFSPLARSFAAPPDPRILAGMPIHDQISLVFADNSEETTAAPVKKAEAPSAALARGDSEPLDQKSILKQSSVEKTATSSVSILKSETSDSHETHSILKSKEVTRVATNVGIKAERVRGILKESQSSTESEDIPSILRRDASPEAMKSLDSILKTESEFDKPNVTPGILRKDSSEGILLGSPRRGILRKEDSADADVDSGTDEQRKKRKAHSALSSSSGPRLRREKAGIKIADQSESESDQEPRIRARSAVVSPSDSNVIAAKTAANKRKSARFTGTSTDRYKTQPISSPTKSPLAQQSSPSHASATTPKTLKTPVNRRQTQPVTPEELKSAKQLMEPVKTTSSIAERLSALKKNGEETWKNRIRKYEDSPTSGPSDRIKVMNNNNKNAGTPSSISDRLKLLQSNAEQSWKSRVEEKDVTQFTVEGKMTKAGIEVTPSSQTPVSIKRSGSFKSRPRGGSFRKRVNLAGEDKKEKEEKKSSSTSEDSSLKLSGFTTSTTDSNTTDTSESEIDFKVIKKKIAIMKPDDDKFSEFFSSSSTHQVSKLVQHSTKEASITTKSTEFEMSVSDFDAITEITKPRLQALSAHRRSLRPQRRVRPSKNPMRALKSHQAVLGEYTEVKMELAEVETKTNSKKENSLEKNGLSSAAKRGLASKEDLKHGMQKLVKPKDVKEMKNLGNLLPYSDIMLIQIKGRRFVQVRLVEPRAKSLNSGDCFVLVTPQQLFLWIGEYANVMEKAKASDIAKHIQNKRDLGCKSTTIIEVEEPRPETGMTPSRNWKKFMKVLEKEEQYTDVGGPDEDEMHEIYITDTNMVYKLDGDSLAPYDDYWGAPPKFEMLGSKEIIVFDFGSELYIWNGKQTSKEQRKLGVKLAQVIWERGYDYTEYDVNPIFPNDKEAHTTVEDERPEWALFCKANQHMETILFSSKFIDWPDDSRVIKAKRTQDGQDAENKSEPAPELVAFDATLMIQPSLERPHLVLEGTNLGRGTGMDEIPSANIGTIAHFDKIERRGNHISTLSVVVWHILEYEHSIMPNECFGQFHEGDTYVVRWQYRVESVGMRDLKGNLSKRGLGHGRERCAYFFWQGSQSTINEKGASALMTVELDDERGPQKQVTQGKEPAAFLHLFQGRMAVHVGKREEEETNTKGQFRLYCVRGEHIEEGFLREVPCHMNQLRSRTCYVLLDLANIETLQAASVHIWYGAKASPATREVALHCANQMVQNKPMEAGLTLECNVSLKEMEEGKENHIFRQALGEDRSVYDSAINDPLVYDYTPRLFHLSSASGMFLANEVLNTYRSEEHVVPYPFFQSDIYSVHQPAQFLFDNHYEVYLWQGWWPAEDIEAEGANKTGSARRRWDIERRCAMETVMAYCNEKNAINPPKAYLVHAGLEPLTFVNLFPFWFHNEEVAELNKQDGKQETHAVLVKDVLQRLTKARYSFDELQERPLPDGVDPLKLENYLEEDEFQDVLKMSRGEFYELPNWKQIDMKKRASLF